MPVVRYRTHLENVSLPIIFKNLRFQKCLSYVYFIFNSARYTVPNSFIKIFAVWCADLLVHVLKKLDLVTVGA
jgi:hypothetical protein